MKTRTIVGLLALLCSSAGFASTVTVTPSVANPAPLGTFFVTVSADGTMPNTTGATLGLTYDSAVVSVASVAFIGPNFNFASTLAGATPGTTDLVSVITTSAAGLTGPFDAFTITFNTLAAGNANIVLVDSNGGDIGWSDDQGATIPGITYTQANVTVVVPDIVVTDAVAPTDDHDIPFGDVSQFSAVTQTVTITNNGGGDLVLGTLAQVDTLAAPYSLVNDQCSGQTLALSTSCTVDVRFAPVATGASSDSFDIPSNDPDTASVTVSMSGNGTVALVPDITVTDTVVPADDLTVGFGDVEVLASADATVTVTNDGTANLDISAVGPLAAPFSIVTDGCTGQSLATASSCQVAVRYSPVATGPASGSLDISSNDPDEATVIVALTGNGTPAPAPNAVVTDSVAPDSDSSIPFGSITVGTSSTQTVTVANSGTAPLVLGPVASANPLAAPFSIGADNCSNQTVAIGANCTFEVVFDPVAAVVSNDALDIPSNDPDSPSITFNVSGTGIGTSAPNIAVSDSVNLANDLLVDFGAWNVGSPDTLNATVTVTNNGTADLVIGNVLVPLAVFSMPSDGCSGHTLVAAAQNIPAGTCKITVTFTPDALQAYNSTLTIPSNDPDSPTVTVNLSGSGDVSDIVVTDSVSPADDQIVGFGNVDLSAAVDQTVTVTNNGVAHLIIGTVGAANPLDAPFSVLAAGDQCSGRTLASGASCHFLVEFAPGALDVYSDSFDISSDDPGEPTVTVAVSGSGVELSSGSGGSALDPETLLGLALLSGLVARRRRRSAV